ANDKRITITRPTSPTTSCTMFFEGGSAYPSALNGGQLVWQNNCASPAVTATLVDGTKSKVSNFTFTSVSPKLVKVNLSVVHQNEQTEITEKQIFFRNA